ncbi:MAG: helix-turn-helix transcriptional regulator [Muribaculaceae bacterium]|nr:helix-turn-helix transcriptional regulator [Muribaculaceae bacterium]
MTTISTLSAGNTTRLKNYDNWKDMPSKQLMQMGKKFLSLEKIDSALVCCNILANRYFIDQQQDTATASYTTQAMNILGIIYTNFFIDYEKANKYLLQAEKIAIKNHFSSTLSSVYINLGSLYLIKCNYYNDGNLDNRTLLMYKKAFETALKGNHTKQILYSAGCLAHIADDSANMKLLYDDINKFLNYPIPDSLKQYSYIKDYCQAIVEQYNGNLEKAENLFDKAYKNIYDDIKFNNDIIKSSILNNKFHLYFQQGQYKKAVNILHSYIKKGKENNNHNLLFISYQSLSEYYHNVKKDSVTGDSYELLALREKEIMLNKNNLLNANNAEFLFQIDEINAEVKELTTRQKMTKMIALSFAAVSLIIIALLYLLWRKYRQVQKNHQLLYENNMALLAVDDERRQLLLNYEAQFKNETKPKYQSHQMEETESKNLLHRILYIMETSEEIYLDSFSLDRLAELVDARSSKYVSQVLNDYYKHSFPTVLNEYRVREACRRINDSQNYGHLTVEGIAQSVGFKSYPNFVNNFKKFTGLTPSVFRKQAKVYS